MASIRSKICRMMAKLTIGSALDNKKTIEEMRLGMEKATKLTFLPSKTNIEQVNYGDIAAEWVSGKNADEEHVVLFLHGGGYNTGSPSTHRELASHISNTSNSKVLVPNYRLAPENPFPAALEDATFSYQWLLEKGLSSKNISIAGDSAGGGLALATCISIRDNGNPMPSSLVCISPWTDLEMTGSSIKALEDIDPVLRVASLQIMASNYIGVNDPLSPLLSPVHGEYTHFPPMLIHTGSDEILLDDSRRVAERAELAGVDITLKIHDGMWHVFHVFYRLMPEAKTAVKELGAFIRKHYK